MLKMEIVLNENTKEESNSIFKWIDRLFEDTDIKKISEGVYVGYENDDDEVSGDLFDFLTISGVLSEDDCFKENVSVWNWYEDEDVEDLINTFEVR